MSTACRVFYIWFATARSRCVDSQPHTQRVHSTACSLEYNPGLSARAFSVTRMNGPLYLQLALPNGYISAQSAYRAVPSGQPS